MYRFHTRVTEETGSQVQTVQANEGWSAKRVFSVLSGVLIVSRASPRPLAMDPWTSPQLLSGRPNWRPEEQADGPDTDWPAA